MSTSYSLAEIAQWVGGVVRGDAGTDISGVSGIAEADKTQITWVSQEKYARQLDASRAGAVVVPETFGATAMPAILCPDPARAIATILERFAPPVPRPPAGVHPTAVVAESAQLGEAAAVGPHVVIGERARIGDRTVLHANVFVGQDTRIGQDCELWPSVVVRERCELGDRVIIHPNSTIGADGYGYEFRDGHHAKIPQIGMVEIGDDVEIGANTAVDRAKFGATRIGAGTKIDNLVQVAHNVQIGPHCLIVGQTGVAGSARLGRGVMMSGKVAIGDHVTLGDGAMVAGYTAVLKDVPAGQTVRGIPAVELNQFMREQVYVRRLPGLAKQLKDLTRRIEQLESSADNP